MHAHLFVLVHGLWGGANHLKSIDDLIHINITGGEEQLHTLRPRTSSLFKTYDGVEIIGQRMLLEILDEIKRLKDEEQTRVTKISFVGYSLGGIVSRYIIGELEKIGFFDIVEPMFFATFATPHLGVRFFKKRFTAVNFLMAHVLGRVGAELAIKDDQKMLVKLTEGEYFSGLKRFKQRFLFANIRHDRTVNFFTAYITDKNPFDDHWEKLDLSFEFEEDIISTYNVKGAVVQPKIVNMKASTFQPSSYKKKPVPLWKRLRYAGIAVALSIILPIWIPIVFTVTTIGSIVSSVIVHTYKKLTSDEIKDLATLDKLAESPGIRKRADSADSTLRERLDEATGEALENLINTGQYDTSTESAKDDDTKKNGQLFAKVHSKANNLMKNLSLFKNGDTDEFEIFRDTKNLPLDDDRKLVMERLNSLDWAKFGAYVNVLNAHDGVVARKGLKRSTNKGIAVVAFWTELVNELIVAESS